MNLTTRMACLLRNLPVQLLAFFLLGSIATAATALDITSYIPHAAGNQWSYQNNNFATETVTMGNPVVLPSGVTAIPETTVTSTETGYTTDYSTIDSNGYRLHQGYVSSVFVTGYGNTSSTITFSPPLIGAPVNVTVGSTYTSSGTASMTYTNVTTVTLSYSSSTQIVGFETVTDYTGTQSWSAMKVITSTTVSGTVNGQFISNTSATTSWHVDGIGEVQFSKPNKSGVMETWKLTSTNVVPPITTPTPFSFAPKTSVIPGALTMSAPFTVSGINVPSPISITGGEYSINSLAYTSAPGMVKAGDWVNVRMVAPMGFGATASAVLNIGGVSASFDVTTMQSMPTGNVLYYSSQAGDYIGQGMTEILSSTSQYTMNVSGSPTSITFSIFQTGMAHWWYLSLRAPGNTPLTAGSYENAQRAAFAPAGVPGLDFSGDGRGCNTVSGRFNVLEAVYDATGNIQKFAVNFEQHCEGGASALFGQLRYNSTIPVDMTLISAYGAGWNLSGNARNVPVNVASVFGDATKVQTVWKWVPAGNTPGITYPAWAFYAPSMTAPNLASYAASKGYEVLSTINGGEGFWVNANADFTAQLPAGASISTAYFHDQLDPAQNKLLKGWNLVAVGDNPTPSVFNNNIGVATPASGTIPINLTTLWAWNNAAVSWYFYAPSLDANGTLGSYIITKNYLNFGAKPLDPTMGFWVNHP